MRLHQPVGIWLLFWPCAWAIILSSSGTLETGKLLLFFIGSVLMRGAGCIINDLADSDIDKKVERTKIRPLASGELNIKQAMIFLSILLTISLIIAVILGLQVIMWAALAMIPVSIYPFMKRISWWPQLFLGLAFNWGTIMGWVAVRNQLELPAIWLYIGGICLTLGYDTIYAHQDKIDDARIGVRSTALRLGEKTKFFVTIMYFLAMIFFTIATGNISNIIFFIPAIIHCIWQIKLLDISKPESAKLVFMSNSYLGFIIALSLFFSLL